MVRYHNFDVVFAEIPGETTLALNITGCPNRCPGCHSPHLQADEGRVLDEAELLGLLARYGRSVTCVAFMGGDAGPHKIARLAGTVRKTCPELRTAWYSGREELPEGFEAAAFDYVKLGGWVEALGPLTAPTTNQRLYRIGPDGTMEDITKLFHGLRFVCIYFAAKIMQRCFSHIQSPCNYWGSSSTMQACDTFSHFRHRMAELFIQDTS